jgi:S-methylmethionine-dependent homocysteine/selenocysteine methylase
MRDRNRHRIERRTMDRYRKLIERARAGERVLIDGATGSEALRRGAPELPNGWSGGAALSHPNIVRQIHAEYIEIGAEMIASNTFATGRNVLQDANVAPDFEAYNRRGVELAVEARDQAGDAGNHVVVAGGVSHWSFSGNHPTLEVLRENTAEQVAIMRSAGAELISLEMMCNTDRLRATLDGVTAGGDGLPVWVGFSIGPEEGFPPEDLPADIELREGGLLAEAVEIAASYDQVDAMFMMHSDVRLIAPALAAIRTQWDGPLGAYAHAAALVDGELVFEDVISPAEYAAFEPDWHAAGATIVGGCCGIGPDHMRVLAPGIAHPD